jgi:hypothetical protein
MPKNQTPKTKATRLLNNALLNGPLAQVQNNLQQASGIPAKKMTTRALELRLGTNPDLPKR